RIARADARDPAAIARSAPRVIVDCAGASTAMALGKGWRGYRAVDTRIGLAAVEAARRANARLVYAATNFAPAQRATPYVDAHERVVAAMRSIDGCVVRANGFFSAFAALLPLARHGLLVDLGDGRARTNPIDERDLAGVVIDAALHDGPREVAAGGPDVMTRAQLFELVAAAAGRRVRIAQIPRWLGRLGALALRPLHPRISQFAAFACGLAAYDLVAPARGTRRLSDYLHPDRSTVAA
ncbi:MAG TPA: hypothetical protein VIV58_19830, partial [Kofleriaceae bacterium]